VRIAKGKAQARVSDTRVWRKIFGLRRRKEKDSG
jgi:hypothetical protein